MFTVRGIVYIVRGVVYVVRGIVYVVRGVGQNLRYIVIYCDTERHFIEI